MVCNACVTQLSILTTIHFSVYSHIKHKQSKTFNGSICATISESNVQSSMDLNCIDSCVICECDVRTNVLCDVMVVVQYTYVKQLGVHTHSCMNACH